MNSESSSVAFEHASLAAAVEQAADSFVITDIGGKIRYVNPAFTAMTGYTSEEVVGQNPRFLKSGSHPVAFYQELWSTILSGRVWQGEVINRRKDGALYHEEMRIAPVRDADGATTGYIAIKHDVTEQRAAQDAQAFLAAIVENSEESIIACTPAGIILTFNRGAEAVFGYSAQEVIGQHMSMLVPPDRSTTLGELAQTLLRGKRFSQYEGFCLRKDGCKIEVSVTGFPIKNSDGDVIAISNILRDITQHKQFERQLRESEERFRAIFEDAPVGMYVAGPDGRLIQVNEAACRMLGYSNQEMLAKFWPDLCHPDDMAEAMRRKRQLLNCGAKIAEAERRFLHRNGTVVWCQVTISLLGSSEGIPPCSVVHMVDITERKQAEGALRESEERFRSMTDSCPSMLWVSNAEGELEFINRMYREFSGITREDMQAGEWRSKLHPDDAPAYLAAFDRAIREHSTFSAEGRVLRADGEWRLVGSRGEPRFSPQGEYLGHIGLRADITERKKANEERQFQHSLIRTIHEVSLDGILVVNGQGKVVSRNAKFLDVWDVTSEEIPDHPVDITTGAADSPHLPPCLERVKDPDAYLKRVHELYADRDANDQCEIELKDGRTLERYSTSLRNEDGEYLARAWFFRDITERKQAEQERQFHHSLISAIFEGSLDGILVVNSDNIIVSHNKKLLDVWRISLAEISGDPARGIVGAHQQPLLSAVLERVNDPENYLNRIHALDVNPDATERGEVELKDGRTLERYSTSLWSEGGQYLGRARFFRDVTERKQAEQALRENEERFRIMADGCPMPMWVTGADGGIQFINRALREFAGAGYEEVEGDKWQFFSHPDDAQGFIEESIRVVRERVPLKTEARFRRADGEWRWLAAIAEPRFSPAGEFLGHIGLGTDITERKQAEQILVESENRFRSMADGCPMPLWITSTDGGIQFINRVFCEFTGACYEQLEGDKWQLFCHPDDAPQFVEESMRTIREHVPLKAEARFKRADGEWRWLAVNAEPRFSPSNEFLGHIGLGTDITERKQAEQALQSSEEKFRQLTENIREVFWIKNSESEEFLYVSPAYEQVWGRTCASIYQNPASRLEAIHPDDLEQSRLMFARQMQGEAVESEYRIRTQEGREKWIRDRAFPVRNSAGQLIRVVGIVEDITERKRHEQELNRAQEKAEAASRQLVVQNLILDEERRILRAFIDNVPDLVYVKDAECKFVLANPEVARWMGMEKPADLLGKTDFDFFPQEVARQFYEDEQSVIRSGKPLLNYEEISSDPKKTEVRYLQTTKVPLLDSEGHVTGIAGIGRDITMRKTMEDALRESNRELQEASDWATKLALEAEAANRSKSEFLANMSHEIRTPMNGVLGMNGLLLGTDLDSEQRHFAEVVDASAKSLLTVIDDILDYSKVEAGKMEIDTMDFNLRVLMEDFAEVMAARVGEKKLEFVCAVASDVTALLQGDPGRLRQVLLNLVSNAMKFTRQGEVVVRVDLVSETEEEAFLRFSVRDTGIGIPANKLPILFTSFTQVDASTTRQYGGTGLGLAISKKLVELMGGKIGVESKEHEGSEFWFTIRLAKQLVNKPVDAAPASVKGTRILVVDDNATNREVLTAQLQSWGAIVAAVESATTALACLRYSVAAGSPFQLAMLDMMMPDMDGKALGRIILADEALKDIPLVMMTSMGQRGDAQRFKEIGFAAYLIKPLRQSDLFDCLVAVLAGERQKETRALITRYSLREVRRGNARILLVEDNLTNQEVAGGMLRRLGWHTDVAADGRQAVQALEKQSYDLVLMDVQMPVMDGYEATRLIRDPQSSVLNHDIPIIATTAHAMAGDAEKCLAAGMSDYISKPIDPNILANIVEKWLTRKVHDVSREAPVESAADGEVPPPKLESGSLVFHREKFLERMMGDEEFAREVAAGFVNELPAMLSGLKEGFEQKDIESVWKQAHKMKGSAANVGGEALRDVAMKVEQAGKAGDPEEVTRWIPELELQCARLNEALQKWGN